MNKRIYFILLITLVVKSLTCCKAQNNNTENMETYDFELMSNTKHDPVGVIRNGWKIVMYKMTNTGAYYNEYPPIPKFYTIQISFYPSGKIQSKIMYTGEGLRIGESIYYDEKGNITKKVNEDAKFGKIKLEDLLKFIEKEGWINLETGEGREDVDIMEDGRCSKIPSDFSISERTDKNGVSFWLITIPPMQSNGFIETIYHVDKDSGEVLYKNSEKIVYQR